MTVTQLLKSTTARELVEWMHFLKIKNEKPEERPEAVKEKIQQTFAMSRFKKKKKK
jgi:hypothetical protein